MSLPALKSVRRPGSNSFLPYGRQVIEEDDIAAVVEALRGDLLTTGPYVARFETSLANAVGAKHAVVCANGTAALHMAARALGLSEGTKIIVPTVTFLATASAAYMNGADIVFADVDPATGLMRPQDLADAFERAGSADAVFNVHLNGQCGEIEEIASLARSHGAAIVDDACHALGAIFIDSEGESRAIGSNAYADLSVFSFHPVKAIAMGEGGAVTTNNPHAAMRLERARGHGMTRTPSEFQNATEAFDAGGAANPWYYELIEPEFNWRANDIQCALGLSQLGKLGRFVARRRALAASYDAIFSAHAPVIRPIGRTRMCLPAWHLYVVRIDFDAAGISRAELMRRLAADGIGSQVHYFPVHRQLYYASRYGDIALPGAAQYYNSVLSLPLFASMTLDDLERVGATVLHHLGLAD
jgi:UDP-4-amino-4,6-dideoxy-N-acetyl-beta-L-altrosamine transaminase